jgi:hypothetical protein
VQRACAAANVQRRVKHSAIPWMMATLDGIVEGYEAVFEAKFMLPWSFSEEAAAEKYMAQVQHNMWVTHCREAVLSIITGGGKWVEINIPMDPLYLTVLVSAEKKFWRCVQSGEVPHLINAEPPRPRRVANANAKIGAKESDRADRGESSPPPASCLASSSQRSHQDQPATEVRGEVDAFQHALPELVSLERYERRALSRRKRAIRMFEAISTVAAFLDPECKGR